MKFEVDERIDVLDTPKQIADCLESIEAYRFYTPYIVLPCCIAAVWTKTQNFLGYILSFLVCLFLTCIGNLFVLLAKKIIVFFPTTAGLFASILIKTQTRITWVLSFICYFVLPFLAVWMLRNDL